MDSIIARTVLYVNVPDYTGGAEISLLTLMRHLDRSRYRPMILTSGEGPLASQSRAYCIATATQDFSSFRKRYPWRYLNSIRRLTQLIHSSGSSLVHSNCDASLRHVMYACGLSRTPYVSHVRDFVRAWFQPANLEALNRAAAVIANSRAVAAACVDAGVAPAKVRVIHNPVDLAPYRALSVDDRRRSRQELCIPDDAFVVGMAGQIQPIKGHTEFVHAAASIASALPAAQFVVVGDAFTAEAKAYKDQIVQLVANLGLSRRFHFLGFRRDLPRILASFDVLTVPSWCEAFGRVVVEGQAAGCLVVGSNKGGIPEIIRDGENGLLIPPQDSDALARRIIWLSGEPGLASRLREAGITSANRFEAGQHVDQVQALYDSVLQNRRTQ